MSGWQREREEDRGDKLSRELTEFYGKIIIGTRVAYWLACRLENTRETLNHIFPLLFSSLYLPSPPPSLISIGSAYANAAGATRFSICMQISCITLCVCLRIWIWAWVCVWLWFWLRLCPSPQEVTLPTINRLIYVHNMLYGWISSQNTLQCAWNQNQSA